VKRLTAAGPVGAVIAGLFLFYAWTAANGRAFPLGQPQDGYYNLLTDALLHGQLHLRVEPDPGLFELSEPYEPGRNARVRLHDASLYRGRYYLYFGVVPAVTLFAPWRLLRLGELPEGLGATLFATFGLAFWVLLLRELVRRHLPQTPRWARLVGVATLGLSSVVPFALRGASVYEVALTAGYLFVGAAAWLFTTADTSRPSEEGRVPGLSLRRLALGSLCLGLAVGCRPNHVLMLPVIPLLALPAWRAALERRVRSLVALAAPVGVVLLLLGGYNEARFDSWFDFGTRYALAGNRAVSWFDLRGVAPAAWFQFLAPPETGLDFPFFLPRTDYPGETAFGFYKEPAVVGLLAHAPFLLVLLAAPWLLRRADVTESGAFRSRVSVLVAAGLLSPLATAFVFPAAAMRYQIDFASFLIVAALVLWPLAVRRASGGRRLALSAAGLAGCAWSWLLAITLSLSGSSHFLQRHNPGLWSSLERRAEPVRVALGRLLDPDDRVVARLRAAFPESVSAAEEPLLSWGRVDAHDVLWTKRHGPGVFSFRLDTADARARRVPGPPPSAPLSFEPGRFYDLAVDLDRVRRRVSVRVDKEPAFELDGRLVPVHPNRVWIARGPRGHGAEALGHFSGTLLSEAMITANPPGLESLPPIAPLPALVTERREEHPSSAARGQLHVIAGRRGAYLFTGDSWRWIPTDFVDRVRLDRLIRPPESSSAPAEPLLVSGDVSGADAVIVRPRGGGRVAFALARWQDGWSILAEGPAVHVGAAHPASVSVVLDRVAHEVTVELARRRVLDASVDLLPLECDRIRLGSAPPGLDVDTLWQPPPRRRAKMKP